MAYVPHDKLIEFCTDVLASAGVARDQAQVTADCMVRADMRGVASHGVIRLPVYYNRLVKGLIDRAPKGRWVVDKQGTALYDAANGLGHYAGRVAMDRAVQKAADHGIAAVGVFNSTHFGMASYYMLSAVNQGFICLASTNSAPRMAPWGGRKPVLGTNPLAIGAPSNLPFPLILDMATSVVALGKLVVAASEGRPVPLGWGLDKDGNETTDPKEILSGSLSPMSGPKGSGLSLMLDVLCGVLTGAAFGVGLGSMMNYNTLEKSGHFFLVIDPESFRGLDAFKADLDQLVEMVRSSGTETDRVYLPGEIEAEREADALVRGVHLEESLIAELNELARNAGCDQL